MDWERSTPVEEHRPEQRNSDLDCNILCCILDDTHVRDHARILVLVHLLVHAHLLEQVWTFRQG